ncbi:MAG TPA: hypothetical protein PKD79_00420 [Candidatus Doudnabacteria bacterium]|nr:hypothetical protein [Candidatus Doudnabacteria bacterium]
MGKKADYRNTRKYRKKDPKYRKPIFMDVWQDLTMTRAITKSGLELMPITKGRYEIKYRPHPDPDKGGKEFEWLTVIRNDGVEVGAARKFFENLQAQGIVRILPPDSNHTHE